MLRNFSTILFFIAAPAALTAQQVELRSSDNFITVDGEIVGYNGVMVSVETTVGQVSVPASEVICYGDGCFQIIQTNTFGLTEASFEGVVSETTEPADALTDDFMISFDAPILNKLYSDVTSAFVVANGTSTRAELAAAGAIALQNASLDQSATIAVAAAGEPSDLRLSTVSLRGTADVAFAAPIGWAIASQLPLQMIGLDAFAVVAAPNVGITSITMDQLADIYAGDLTNWSQIGGADLNILPLQLPENSAVRDEMIALIMEPAGKSIAANVLTMADEKGLAQSVNQFPGSVSVVGIAGATENTTLAVAGACGVGVEPTPFGIKSGDYPLVRPIMVSYDREPNTGLLTEFFDFASTDVPQELLARNGFTKLSGMSQDSVEKSARLSSLLNAALDDAERVAAAQMFQVLFEAERLSPTMSGGETSGPEGAWNRVMLRDLAALLDNPDFAGKEVVFAGFGESENGSQAAIDASTQAAQEMQAVFSQTEATLIRQNNLTLSAFGFGGVAPSTCYDGQVPSPSYSRVEVWVR